MTGEIDIHACTAHVCSRAYSLKCAHLTFENALHFRHDFPIERAKKTCDVSLSWNYYWNSLRCAHAQPILLKMFATKNRIALAAVVLQLRHYFRQSSNEIFTHNFGEECIFIYRMCRIRRLAVNVRWNV